MALGCAMNGRSATIPLFRPNHHASSSRMTSSASALPDVVVRPAEPSDVCQLQDLVDHFVRANRLLPRTIDELEDLIPRGFVAVLGDRIVGFAALEIYSRKLAEVRSLAVVDELQGRGIGKRLVEECVRLASEKNVLEVMAVTSSDQFFRNCGFDFTLPGEKKALFIQTRENDSEPNDEH